MLLEQRVAGRCESVEAGSRWPTLLKFIVPLNAFTWLELAHRGVRTLAGHLLVCPVVQGRLRDRVANLLESRLFEATVGQIILHSLHRCIPLRFWVQEPCRVPRLW